MCSHAHTALACAAAALLPGCRSCIGQNIRNSAQVQLDADVSELYRCGADILAPERSCRLSVPWLYPDDYADLESYSEVKRTGACRVLTGKLDGLEYDIGERRPADTPGLERLTGGSPRLSWQPPLGASRHVERSTCYPLAAVAAAPFDYLPDPAFTLILTPPCVLLRACGFCGLMDELYL